MVILVDGDACPNILEIKILAKRYQTEMLVFIDYAHNLNDDYFKTISCEVGNDSVDLTLLRYISDNDLVISQDYGLASLALSKGAKVLHISGLIITEDNIERLLISRYLGAKARRSGKRIKGPAKRSYETEQYFLKQLERLLSI